MWSGWNQCKTFHIVSKTMHSTSRLDKHYCGVRSLKMTCFLSLSLILAIYSIFRYFYSVYRSLLVSWQMILEMCCCCCYCFSYHLPPLVYKRLECKKFQTIAMHNAFNFQVNFSSLQMWLDFYASIAYGGQDSWHHDHFPGQQRNEQAA